MRIEVAYRKPQVLQALRYHFISRPEIKIMIILVNVFALMAAVLLYMKKIGPMPFLLSSVLWLSLMTAFWIWLPALIYRRSKTFQDRFAASIEDTHFHIDTQTGRKSWAWREIRNYYETPGFIHIYFDPRSFFLLPKTGFKNDEDLTRAREILRNNVRRGTY